MKNFNSKFKIFILIALITHYSLLITHEVRAQTAAPRFLVSWQAESYAPGWFQGKIFPTKSTPVTVSFELIDKGRIVDLSKTAVRWYINDKLIQNEDNGLGIKSLRFVVPDYAGRETELRIAIPDYRGNPLDSITIIPSKAPEAVIKSTYVGRLIRTGGSSFEAIPYFFNITSLDNLFFTWSANGQPSASSDEEPYVLDLDIEPQAPSGFVIDLQVIVQNLSNKLEFTSKNIQLSLK